MIKRDKHIPWIVVGLSGVLLATIGRYIVLKATQDVGSANLTFVIVLITAILVYLLFITLVELISEVIAKRRKKEVLYRPELPEGEFKNSVDTFCRYSDEILKGYVSDDELQLLHTYIRQYAEGETGNIAVKIKSVGVDKYDLYHYGWNIYNHFKAAQQPETADWLINAFVLLDGSKRVIYKKFKHDERAAYKIPIEYNIK